MFAARQGFFPPITAAGFGNSGFWSPTYDSNRWLSVPSTTDLITWKATSGYTVEYWIYNTTQWPGSINPGPGNHDPSGTNYWSFGPGATGQLEFYYWGPGTSWVSTATSVLALDTWYNVCMVATTDGSNNTTISLYINGVRQQVQTGTGGGNFASSQTVSNGVISTGTPFLMGQYSTAWRGFVDNLRVSNTARYSGASYALATSPFTSDAQTQLLMIMDGPNGGTTFTDSSSFNRTVTNNQGLVNISNARANHS